MSDTAAQDVTKVPRPRVKINVLEDEDFVDAPYRGVSSYSFEDGDLFFGRENDTRRIAAQFIAAPLSILHAPSGAGKSSTLSCRVIPELVRANVACVRVTPGENPFEEVLINLLLQAMPGPSVEAVAIRRLISHCPELAQAGLDQLAPVYASLERRDERRRLLLAPVRTVIDLDGRKTTARIAPFFCKLLAGVISTKDYARHLRTMFATHPFNLQVRRDRWRNEPLAVFLEGMLATDDAREAHRELLNEIAVTHANGQLDLAETLRTLCDVFTSEHPGWRLCLIVDQFEELFARFVGKPGELRSVDLRRRFFDALATVAEKGKRGELPVNIALSMREEYTARLLSDPKLRRFFSTGRYRLDFLTPPEAKAAVHEPAAIFGYTYDAECYEDIERVLLRNDGCIEPAHIQIICDRLWRDFGKSFHEDQQSADDIRTITFREYMARTGGARKIRNSFLDHVLDGLTDEEEIEAHDLLFRLLTPSRTRNLHERQALVDRPLYDHGRREKVLAYLKEQGVIRLESRLGHEFAEIAHEFIVDPLLKQVEDFSRRHPKNGELRFAMESFGEARRTMQDDPAAAAELLSSFVIRQLSSNVARIRWDPIDTEIALRAGILHGVSREDYHQLVEAYDALQQWSAAGPSSTATLIESYVDHPDERIRANAVEALCALGGERGIGKLRQIATTEDASDVELRAASVRGLASLGGAPAMRALVDVALEFQERGNRDMVDVAVAALAALPREDMVVVSETLWGDVVAKGTRWRHSLSLIELCARAGANTAWPRHHGLFRRIWNTLFITASLWRLPKPLRIEKTWTHLVQFTVPPILAFILVVAWLTLATESGVAFNNGFIIFLLIGMLASFPAFLLPVWPTLLSLRRYAMAADSVLVLTVTFVVAIAVSSLGPATDPTRTAMLWISMATPLVAGRIGLGFAGGSRRRYLGMLNGALWSMVGAVVGIALLIVATWTISADPLSFDVDASAALSALVVSIALGGYIRSRIGSTALQREALGRICASIALSGALAFGLGAIVLLGGDGSNVDFQFTPEDLVKEIGMRFAAIFWPIRYAP